eukprot:m.25294 g.25294  ORF g.25294 m.25294 type:complete len:437 (+) comp14943_c1_seq1:80-1390(+)
MATSTLSAKDQHEHIQKFLARPGPFATESFNPKNPYLQFLQTKMKVLVIGAGGLGCELLKNLALLGFGNIHVIDMDTIDLSNLNRQFLFRQADVGKAKAECAAAFINKRIANAQVTPHFKRIEDFDKAFYKQFQIVVCGLDSVTARRWMNSMLHDCLDYDADGNVKPWTVIPLVDGGTEGFRGSTRVIYPGKTVCIECTLDLYPPQVNFPYCTIAHRPRLPEHCIEYAKEILWYKEQPAEVKLDGDDPEHIKWLMEKASERADEFGIKGVTYRLTQGVVKNIIPAVASTNAVIAASCANEVFKIATSCCGYLDNYMSFEQTDGLYTGPQCMEDKKADCSVCSNRAVPLECDRDMSLTALIQKLKSDVVFQFNEPCLSTRIGASDKNLYMTKPAALEEMLRPNLDKSLSELGVTDGGLLTVQDPTSARPITFECKFA